LNVAQDNRGVEKINPFVTGLSIVNMFFSLLMTLFGYTLFYLLEANGVSIYWGALGLSLGQILLIVILVPQGRAIDRGHSYGLMLGGSLVYGVSIGIFFFIKSFQYFDLIFLVPVVIMFASTTQNTFRSAMNSFIGKAVKAALMGQNYARIITMEMVGGSVAMFLSALFLTMDTLRFVYGIFSVFLIVSSLLIFTMLFRKSRTVLVSVEKKQKRPGFFESLRTLSARKRFVIPLYLGKIMMAIGYYGFSYYFILTGLRIGISSFVSIILLGLVFAASVPFGKLAETLLNKFQNAGKSYVVMLSIIDVSSYTLLFLSVLLRNPLFYYLSVAVMIPGPLPTAGALGYEVRMIGSENRGIYGSVQRILVAVSFIVISIPLAALYYFSVDYLWLLLLATSVSGLIFGISLPSSVVAVKTESASGS
jgi:hypothetical protein